MQCSNLLAALELDIFKNPLGKGKYKAGESLGGFGKTAEWDVNNISLPNYFP